MIKICFLGMIVIDPYGTLGPVWGTVTDVRRGTSGTSVDAPIFVHFLKKAQNSYTLVVKNPKFIHFGGKKTKIRTLWW